MPTIILDSKSRNYSKRKYIYSFIVIFEWMKNLKLNAYDQFRLKVQTKFIKNDHMI